MKQNFIKRPMAINSINERETSILHASSMQRHNRSSRRRIRLNRQLLRDIPNKLTNRMLLNRTQRMDERTNRREPTTDPQMAGRVRISAPERRRPRRRASTTIRVRRMRKAHKEEHTQRAGVPCWRRSVPGRGVPGSPNRPLQPVRFLLRQPHHSIRWWGREVPIGPLHRIVRLEDAAVDWDRHCAHLVELSVHIEY